MKEIKEQFKNWLIEQGLSEKTSTGRPGTVYEYIRHIDNICDTLTSNTENSSWIWLADNIYYILGFYTVCKDGPVQVNKENYKNIINFIDVFLGHFYDKIPETHFIIRYPNTEIDSNYKLKRLVLYTTLGDEDTPLDLKINLSPIIVNNQRKALQKFYQFLEAVQYDPNFKENQSQDDEKKRSLKLKEHYLAISSSLNELRSWSNPKSQVFAITMEGGYYIRPPHLRATIPDETMDAKAIMRLLQISEWSLKHLHKTGELTHLAKGEYYVKDVDDYIKKCFHKSESKKEVPNAKDIVYWWTAEQISDKFKISMQRVGQLRNRVAHLKIVNRKYLYYPYDFKKFIKKAIRIHDKK